MVACAKLMQILLGLDCHWNLEAKFLILSLTLKSIHGLAISYLQFTTRLLGNNFIPSFMSYLWPCRGDGGSHGKQGAHHWATSRFTTTRCLLTRGGMWSGLGRILWLARRRLSKQQLSTIVETWNRGLKSVFQDSEVTGASSSTMICPTYNNATYMSSPNWRAFLCAIISWLLVQPSLSSCHVNLLAVFSYSCFFSFPTKHVRRPL